MDGSVVGVEVIAIIVCLAGIARGADSKTKTVAFFALLIFVGLFVGTLTGH